MEKQKLLVALDEHSISTELVKYLGKIISGKEDMEVCLVHMLPPPPPQLREFRGSEDPEVEEQLDREMDVVCQRWTREAENAARPVFENAISILTRAGVPPNSIRRIVRQLVNHEDLTDDILKLAEEKLMPNDRRGQVVVPMVQGNVSSSSSRQTCEESDRSHGLGGRTTLAGFSEDRAHALETWGRPA